MALIELNDPPANTYSYEMMQEIDAAVLAARMDDAVHVIVLTGAGEKFFCAGANIGMLQDATPTFKYYFCLHANETMSRLEQTPKLVIAGLNGHTVGGGLEVAMAADLRVARQGSGKIGLPEVALGVLPGTGGTQRLARAGREGAAIELMVSGTLLSFDQATPSAWSTRCGAMATWPADRSARRCSSTRSSSRRRIAPAGRWGHQARRAVGAGNEPRRRPRPRARTAAAAVRERGCARGHRRQPGKAPTAIHRPLTARRRPATAR